MRKKLFLMRLVPFLQPPRLRHSPSQGRKIYLSVRRGGPLAVERLKKKSEFSSKKVSELKVKNKKKSEKVIQPKKNNDFFGNQEIKQDLQSFYNSEAKKYAETRKKFWHEEKAILDAITPLFTTPSASPLPLTGEKIFNSEFCSLLGELDCEARLRGCSTSSLSF